MALWCCYGVVMVLSCFSYGVDCCYNGVVWYCHGVVIPYGVVIIVLLCCCYGVVMVLS